MFHFRSLTTAIALLIFGPLLSAQTASPDRTAVVDKIAAFVAAHHALDQFQGAALVAEEGEVIYEGAFGLANADWRIPNGIDTKFRLASVTKQFTAMLILLLVEEGKLALDAPITTYLPDYPKESGEKVTIHHLLRHTSGIPSYTSRPGFMQKDSLHRLPVDEFVATYCSDPLEFEPGAEFRYSNSGYFLLGAIAEAVTEETYAEALQARIFGPLGMRDSGVEDQNAVLPKRAMGYDEFLGEQRLSRWIDMSNPGAAGALYSTVRDLWMWDRALQAKTLLGGKLEEQMFTPGLGDYGYGWGIDRSDPASPRMMHSGGINGFSTRIERAPAKGRCVIVLSNSSSAAVGNIVRGISEILEGGEPETPARRPDRMLAFLILDEGPDAGVAKFEELKDQLPGPRVERDLNQIGYGLLGRGRIDDAIQIFIFNTRAFPETANCWDSLGEGYAEAGNRQRAIESYRKALELDPAMPSARTMLEKLTAEQEASEEKAASTGKRGEAGSSRRRFR